MDMVQIIIDFSIIGVLLLVGTLIRSKVGIFQKFVIPASVIGGLVGLVLGSNLLGWLPVSDSMVQYPTILIDVLFAGLFLGRTIPGFGRLAKTAGAQAAFAYFNAFGQIAIGLLVVAVFGALGVALHPAFGLQLIVGFQGGPGVATAIAPMIDNLGWKAAESAAVGETCAIAGLILAVLVGIVLVNVGISRNLSVKKFSEAGQRIESPTFLGDKEKKSIGMEITSPDAVSSLAYNFGFMALAIIGGKLIVLGIVALAPPLKFLPSFPFVLVAGILLQSFLQKARLDKFVDRGSIEAIASFSLDILIVSSLIAVNFGMIATFALPIITMIVLGVIFNLWQIIWLAPRILPGAWFEKALCEFGQNTGSVPQSLLLLRMVDPRIETDAAEALALKMVLFSPVMFPLTMILLPFIVSKGPLLFVGVFGLAMIVVLGICRLVSWHKRPAASWLGEKE